MTIITWLVLLTAQTPALTFMKIDEFDSPQKCTQAVQEFVKERNLPESQARRLTCLPIVIAPIKDA